MGLGSEEKVQFARFPELPGIEILRVENCTRLFSVFHTAYEVCTVLPKPAFTEWKYRGKMYAGGSRGTCLMEPGELHHNLSMTGTGDFRVLFIPLEVMKELSTEHEGTSTPHFQLAQSQHQGLYRTFVRLHRALEGVATPLERQSNFITCIRTLFETCIEKTDAPPQVRNERMGVRRAREFLLEHYASGVSLEQLSEAAGLSRFHLLRAFKQELGLPPHAFQLQLRIARARELLNKKMEIAHVAQEVGFYDQSHLSHYFKMAWGISPAKYVRG